ncbi:hypothetical protein SEA_SUERTE_43 [Gordonia phage Suerte]|uniref:DUF7323 domain-containing protein n=1 Tax=Gordonia phage Suerte TaxID=2652883 RepID=A0A5P8DDD2_9CAUD|nr:hypothetical protein PP511_gp43 [Gordonia phage Suerte]QFP97014.1 hypothetical protein SEA_SUERTE_43 [Gordonia phage Suerte]
MTAAVWRPTRREAYPVLGVESYGGHYADVVVDLPSTGPTRITVPVEDIRVSPDRSIVSALTADFTPRFTDHSDARSCGCGVARLGDPRSTLVAQAGAEGAAPVTNFPQK